MAQLTTPASPGPDCRATFDEPEQLPESARYLLRILSHQNRRWVALLSAHLALTLRIPEEEVHRQIGLLESLGLIQRAHYGDLLTITARGRAQAQRSADEHTVEQLLGIIGSAS